MAPGTNWPARRAAAVLLVLALGLAGSAQLVLERAPMVWVAGPMERIARDDYRRASGPVLLAAARGEYEPFQLVVHAPPGGLTNVMVQVSDLHGPAGALIARQYITLYREHYVYVAHASPDQGGPNRSLGAGWYPDALIPLIDPATGHTLPSAAPFAVPAHGNQPIWADLFVPRETPAGAYSGGYIVTSDQGTAVGRIDLTVWRFTLPLQPSLRSSFEVWASPGTAVQHELKAHRLMPKNVDVAAEPALIHAYGLSATALGLWSGADIRSCAMRAPPAASELARLAAQHRPELLLYNHTADEIGGCEQLDAPLKTWARRLHAAGVANLVTIAPRPDLLDDGAGTGRSAVDIWVVLPVMYERSQPGIAAVLAKGDQVWSYNALVQDAYSPKWQIDFAPINYRIQPGFLSQSLGLTGLLYWRVDLWTADPWNDVETYVSGAEAYPGEGMLVYPGQPVGLSGVAPSMRLKWLREGVEDYEYVELLKQRGQGAWALELVRALAPGWSGWTHDPAAIERARHELGTMLDQGYDSSLQLAGGSAILHTTMPVARLRTRATVVQPAIERR